MRRIFFTLMVIIVSTSTINAWEIKEINIDLSRKKIENVDPGQWDDADERSQSITIKATYNNESFYIYSLSIMEETQIKIKNKNNIILYSIITTLESNHKNHFPMIVSQKGQYRLEIEHKGICYYGDFEIQ